MNTDSATKDFKFIGGMLCLDFVNTVEGRSSRQSKKGSRNDEYIVHADKLRSYSDLVLWCQHEQTSLLTEMDARHLLRLAKGHSRTAQAVFERAIKLREALYRILKSVAGGRKPNPSDMEKLNEELIRAREREKLVFSAATFEAMWEEMGRNLDSPLWPVIRSAADLLTSGDFSRLRQCGGEECGWLFLDTSRNRSRQWCDMKDCGNLAKVRRFRERRQEAFNA